MRNAHRDHPRVRSGDATAHGLACDEPWRSRRGVPAVRKEQQGFSLVEVLVTIVLTVIAVVAIMEGCIRQQALQRLDSEMGHVYRTCRTQLDELRAMPLDQLRALDGAGFVVVGSNGVAPILTAVPGDTDGLPGHIHVREERTAGGRALYRIETSVQWLGATGRHSVAFATLRGGVP